MSRGTGQVSLCANWRGNTGLGRAADKGWRMSAPEHYCTDIKHDAEARSTEAGESGERWNVKWSGLRSFPLEWLGNSYTLPLLKHRNIDE